MIITCASCLTKFTLDDSKIPAQGAKVRCSRCQHIFHIVPPAATKEEIAEDFESFMEQEERKGKPPPTPTVRGKEEGDEKVSTKPTKKAEPAAKEEIVEDFESFMEQEERKGKPPPTPMVRGKEERDEKVSTKPKKKAEPTAVREETKVEAEIGRPRRVARKARKGPSLVFTLLVIILFLVFGGFYLWTELESGGRLSPYLDSPIKKITDLWDQIWGSEKEGLIIRDLNRYEEKVGEVPFFIIEGMVYNQSRFTKKHIKVRVVIYDENKIKVAEKETLCGQTIGREELKKLPPAFLKGEIVMEPQKEKDMATPSGKSVPFMVAFKGLPVQTKEFKVEIVEAPNL